MGLLVSPVLPQAQHGCLELGYLERTLPGDIRRLAGCATPESSTVAEDSDHIVLGMSHLV